MNQYWQREYRYEWDLLLLKCTKCWERLTSDKYNKDKSKSFWLRTECRECQHKRGVLYHRNNRDKIIKKVKEWGENNKDRVDWYKKKYRESHREKASECVKANYKRHSDESWFNWGTFHTRAMQFVRKHRIRPNKCPICWDNKNIVMHHPSYKEYNDWRKVVFCCQWCHKKIHSWQIECPPAILLDS